MKVSKAFEILSKLNETNPDANLAVYLKDQQLYSARGLVFYALVGTGVSQEPAAAQIVDVEPEEKPVAKAKKGFIRKKAEPCALPEGNIEDFPF